MMEGGEKYKGMYQRGWNHLPHIDKPGLYYHVTMRLARTMPGHGPLGPSWLDNPELADIVQAALEHHDGVQYRLHVWCIMPNHVHVLFKTFGAHHLQGIVGAWKGVSARRCNKIIRRTGTPFWQPGFHDRYIRDGDHYLANARYIVDNGGRCWDREQGLHPHQPAP